MENTNVLGDRLKKARTWKKLSQMDAAKKIGISNGTLSGYERNYRDPDTDTLYKMADLYEVSVDWLVGRTDNPEMDRVGYIQKIFSPENKQAVKESLANFTVTGELIRIPVLGHISAGKPILADDHIEYYKHIVRPAVSVGDDLFLLEVKGDSMIDAGIIPGYFVLVKMQSEVENGQIAVVNVNGDEATLKRVKKLESGQTLLVPENKKYDPIIINDDKARIIGKVIQVIFEP